jgi:segregation and condensation protein A
VDQIRARNLELAAKYAAMAAMLIEIKSRMLLPPKKSEDGREPEDPRAELVRRLLEYERIKLAAARLDQLPLAGRDFLRAQVAHRAEPAAALARGAAPTSCARPWAQILKRAPS